MNNPDILGNNVHFSVWGGELNKCSQVHSFYIAIYNFLADSVTLQSFHFQEEGADTSNHDFLFSYFFLSFASVSFTYNGSYFSTSLSILATVL